jgi:hypothetical protein
MQINLPLIPEKGKRTLLYIGLGILVLAGMGFAYKLFIYKKPATGNYTAAKPADGMANAPTHTTPPVKLQAYDKETAGKKMQIPEIILKDPKLELVGTGRVKPSPGGYTIGAVTNIETGKTEIITKEEPRPLFGWMGKSEIGALAGVSTGGDTAIIYAKQDILRIGSVNLAAVGGVGTVGGKLGAGAFVDVGFRW